MVSPTGSHSLLSEIIPARFLHANVRDLYRAGRMRAIIRQIVSVSGRDKTAYPAKTCCEGMAG